MDLDLSRYLAYEREGVESALSVGFDPARLPADTPLFNFHNMHWPPACLDEPDSVGRAIACSACDSTTPRDFARLDRLLQIAVDVLSTEDEHRTRRRVPRDPTEDHLGYFLRWLPRLWPEVTARRRDRSRCLYDNPDSVDYLRTGLTDLEGCFREMTTQQLRRFFDLPYWKARWQLFEIWVLSLVIDSYGTHRWSLNLTETVWDLKAGSTNQLPIATAVLPGGRELRCYYQHESIPPASLVPDAHDRPEMLVTSAENSTLAASPGAEHEPVLLAVEAKARSNYRVDDMKGAIYSLIEWQPARILGASYFAVSGAGTEPLHVQRAGSAEVALAQALTPKSAAAAATRHWLRSLWRDLVGARVTIVAADISASMPDGAVADRLEVMIGLRDAGEVPDWVSSVVDTDVLFLSTFGGEDPILVSLDTFSSSTIATAGIMFTPRTKTQHFAATVTAWESSLDQWAPTRQRVDLHLITDGCWSDADLAALDRCYADGVRVYVHLVPARIGRVRRELYRFRAT